MNIITMELNFLEVNEKDLKFFDFIIDSNGIPIKVDLSKKYFSNHKKFSKQFKEYFGSIRLEEFLNKLSLIEEIKFSHGDKLKHQQLANEAIKNQKIKELADRIYGEYHYDLQIKAVSLSTAIWLLKDSCVQSNLAYTIIENGYSSASNSDMNYTMANGSHQLISVDDSEIKSIKEYYELVFPVINSRIGNKEIETINITNHYSLFETDKIDRSKFASYARALVYLQEARKSGLIASKIDKYMQVLQCLYAFEDGTRRMGRKLKNITANLLSEEPTEKQKIIDNIAIAYKIRSQHTHGNRIKFGQNEIERISIVLDDYVREVLKKLLPNKELNYLDEETRLFVEKHMRQFNEGKFSNFFKKVFNVK
ncbi:hypothetical protein ACVR0O_05225 [Streptococcus caviae]|uniref:hypothetical protein n=1 Tax=Streptococcus sp. 'caviae' TaxID=1915004 RepID=UPI00094BB62A|nr:hypothetical protein [Streptococcus sp. 'caviae']OLN84006.1 hypothetical protein BMI76_02070 [Streptococcus sp. 'caviae']